MTARLSFETVAEAVRAGPVSTRMVAHRLQIDVGEARRLLKGLKKAGRIKRCEIGGVRLWETAA